MLKNIYKVITALVLSLSVMALAKDVTFADCDPTYGGGETCVYNKRFVITKEVRLEGDSNWYDKVTNVEKGDIVEFRITVKNLSDEDAGSFDNMKMKDILPSEMYRIGGAGLSEYWEDFEPGEKKTFIISTRVNDSEYDRDGNWEKCVVNKAEAYWDGNFEGSDTATVCYGNVTLTELPETGAFSSTAIAGLGLLFTGSFLKRKAK